MVVFNRAQLADFIQEQLSGKMQEAVEYLEREDNDLDDLGLDTIEIIEDLDWENLSDLDAVIFLLGTAFTSVNEANGGLYDDLDLVLSEAYKFALTLQELRK